MSKVIDALIADGNVEVNPDADTSLARDGLIEIEGGTRITAASSSPIRLSTHGGA